MKTVFKNVRRGVGIEIGLDQILDYLDGLDFEIENRRGGL